MNETKVNIRCVTVKGITYMRIEDVCELLKEIGATEDTDVRNRLEKAAKILTTGGQNVDPL